MWGVGRFAKRTVDVLVYPASAIDRRSLNLSSILIATSLVFEHEVAYKDCIIISVFYNFLVVVDNALKLSGHYFVSLDTKQRFGFLRLLDFFYNLPSCCTNCMGIVVFAFVEVIYQFSSD